MSTIVAGVCRFCGRNYNSDTDPIPVTCPSDDCPSHEVPKTLAELRRYLTPGTKIRLVESLLGPTPPGKQEREVSRWQSNALVLRIEKAGQSVESFAHFQRASEFTFEPDGFTLWEIDGDKKVLAARYEYFTPKLACPMSGKRGTRSAGYGPCEHCGAPNIYVTHRRAGERDGGIYEFHFPPETS